MGNGKGRRMGGEKITRVYQSCLRYIGFYLLYLLAMWAESALLPGVRLKSQQSYDLTAVIGWEAVFCSVYVLLILARTHLNTRLPQFGIVLHAALLLLTVLGFVGVLYFSGSCPFPLLMLGVGEFSNRMNPNTTTALDEAIVTFFQIYRDTFDGYARMGSHTPKPARDICEVKGDYVYTTAALASKDLDLSEIYQYFKAALEKKEEGVKYVYSCEATSQIVM